MTPIQEKQTARDAATLAYLDQGEGPALVILPSLGRGPADYDDLAARLAAMGIRVLRPFPRGIGASRGPMTGLTLQDLAADVAAVIDAEGLAPVAVAGHAFGNFVARTLATDLPDRVRGVALVAASPGRTLEGGSPFTPAVLESVYLAGDERLSTAERLVHLQRAFFAPGNDASVWLGGWHAETKAMQKEAQAVTPVDHFFACGNAPILDLQAEDDTVAPRHLADVLRQCLGERVDVQVIPRAGHALVPEQPAAVAQALAAWVRRLA